MNLNEEYLLKFLLEDNEVFCSAEIIKNNDNYDEQRYLDLYFAK